LISISVSNPWNEAQSVAKAFQDFIQVEDKVTNIFSEQKTSLKSAKDFPSFGLRII
jgi:hypothetical protein